MAILDGAVTRALIAAAILASVAVAACRNAGGTPAPGPISVLAVAGASSASASISTAGSRVVVVWIATNGDKSSVYAAVSEDDGGTFGAPVLVNHVPGDVRSGGDQGPRVSAGASDEIAVVWTSKLTGTSRIRMARSLDGGKSFGPAVTVSGDGLTGARGWASVARDASGTLHAAWLDGRDAGAEMAGAAMAHTGSHVMRQDLYQATWRPGGPPVETRIATGVCFCCKTGIAVAPDGTTYVAWRHVYPTNLRDMAVAASVDHGQTFGAPVRVSEDHWQIEGCPEDGPAIAVDARNVLHIVWPTMLDGDAGRKRVFYSTSSDRGRTFTSRRQLGATDARTVAAHPQLTTLGDATAAVWDEDGPSGQHIELAVLPSPSGGPATQVERGPLTVGGGEAGHHPSVAATARAMVVCWVSSVGKTAEIHVQRIAR